MVDSTVLAGQEVVKRAEGDRDVVETTEMHGPDWYNPYDGQPMKIRDVLELLREDGWYLVRQRGSHRQFRHPGKPGRVTIAGHPGDDIPPGTLSSILRQAGLRGGRD